MFDSTQAGYDFWGSCAPLKPPQGLKPDCILTPLRHKQTRALTQNRVFRSLRSRTPHDAQSSQEGLEWAAPFSACQNKKDPL
jgi:hypothetical protein